ncbi:uncharacterized protein LOC132713680 [Ruditapes philippinarum]|uniref:uncharacterized protein LOC132713680 n=1 Tax=Ruditapes philippinarum TaxID=129788 RepID=UPI00295B6825|nr:uncharacterized protein LOC132713680 [Ruditapes philippinarum]
MNSFIALLAACFVFGADASTTASHGNIHIPTGAALDKIIDGSFKNFDNDHDNFIERYEFDTLIIVADSDNNGCMTITEYENFSAGGTEVASRIYKHFDVHNTNCLKVSDVASEFAVMDTDKNQKVTKDEFRQYYINLLNVLFAVTDKPVG